MGVHDYICFIQRNGQALELINPEDQHSTQARAILVIVPISYTVREILSWSLHRFAKFPHITAEYSWDGWEFEEVEGYNEAVFESEKPWYEETIWTSPTYPKARLVTFAPDAYRVFVEGRDPPLDLDDGVDEHWLAYLDNVYSNRGYDRPSNIKDAMLKIVKAGPENLWQYDGPYGKLASFKLPYEYSSMKKKVLAQDIFSSDQYYELKSPPNELSRARLAILIKDHLESGLDNISLTAHRGAQESSFCVKHDKERAVYQLRFSILGLGVDTKNDQCLVKGCQRHNWPALWTCWDHSNEDGESLVEANKVRIIRICQHRLPKLEKLLSVEVPKPLLVCFEEKGIKYKLKLRHTTYG